MAPLCHLEAEALLEHDFKYKKCAVPSREGLSSGKFQLEGGCVARGTNVAPELWVMTDAPLSLPPCG